MDVFGCPLRRRRDNIFYDGAKVVRENDVPNGGNRFAPEGGPFTGGQLFFGAMTCWRGFFEKEFGRGEI